MLYTTILTALGRTSDGTRSRTLPIPTRGRFFRVLRPLKDRHCASCGGTGWRSAEDDHDTSISGMAESLAYDFEVQWLGLIVKSHLQVDRQRESLKLV